MRLAEDIENAENKKGKEKIIIHRYLSEQIRHNNMVT